MAAVFHPGFTPLRSSAAPRRSGALVAVALHGLAAAGLLSYAPARNALVAAAPIMVELISAPAVQSRPTQPAVHPRPRPVAKSVQPPAPVPPSQLLAAPSEVSPAAPAAPTPVAAARPAPPPAEPIAAAPVAVAPPVFNAAYLDNPAPTYPALSRRMHEEGRVILRVLVTPAGTAEDVQVRALERRRTAGFRGARDGQALEVRPGQTRQRSRARLGADPDFVQTGCLTMEPTQALGFAGFLAQTDAVSKAILAALACMSVASWYSSRRRPLRCSSTAGRARIS